MKIMKNGLFLVLVVLFIFSNLSSGEISFVGEGYIPEPNEEITLQIQTDTPLFAMGAAIYVVGDANITGATCEADCNQFGWDNGWNSDPYIDPNGWVYIGGVRWASDANGIIGYIKFRYNSGCVNVYIDQEDSLAFSWDANGCHDVSFSTDSLVFGTCDANDSSQSENSLEENISAAEVNNVNLPLSGFLQQAQQEPRGHLMRCPVNSNSLNNSETVSTSFWKTLDNRNFQNNIMSELAVEDGGGQSLMGSEPNIIEINSDITTNQIWTANNVYYVTTPINVQALLVIEPGTIIMFSDADEYYDCALYVNNGGTLISKGTPDKPIVYTCDFLYFKEPKEIGCYWQYIEASGKYSFCPIFIERTASTATTVIYNFIEGGHYGILTDNISLDHPIENNYLSGNFYGIFEGGTRHTDIINNLCFYNFDSGIEIYLADANGTGDANSHVLIQNNTCDRFQNQGIYIHGVMDANQAGTVMLINNIVTESYWYGISLVDGDMWAIVSNTGYGANRRNKNWEFEEYNPVEVNDSPYNYGNTPYEWFYLEPNCAFIDAGLEYIEQTPLIGKTTDINSIPDSNKIDIGFHYPNWDYSNANTGFAASDFNKDTITDYKDLYTIATNWLDTVEPNSNGDLNGDETVNFKDFTLFANNWQKIQGEPNVVVSISGDANGLSGDIGVSVANCPYSTYRLYVFMDGLLIGKSDNDENEAAGLAINTPAYLNGSHSLKIVVADYNTPFVISESTPVNFDNPLHCSNLSDTYEPNQPLRLLALNSAENNLQVKLAKWDGEVIWSQQTSGDLDITIPGSTLTGPIYDMSVEQETSGTYAMNSLSTMDSGTSWESIWEKAINKKYKYSNSYKFAIFLPSSWRLLDRNSADCRKEAVAQIVSDCERRGVKYVVLYKGQCTWDNFVEVLNGSQLSYVYMVSRGNSVIPIGISVDSIQRTHFELTDCEVVSYKASDYGGTPPSSYVYLPEDWETRLDVHSMCSIGIGTGHSQKLRIVNLDFCLQAKYSDMAYYWIDTSQTPILEQLFVSWNAPINTTHIYWRQWSRDVWYQLGIDGGTNWYQAQNYARVHNTWGDTINQKVQYYGWDQVNFSNAGNQ